MVGHIAESFSEVSYTRRVRPLQTLTHGTESKSAVSYTRRVLSPQTLTHGTESNSAVSYTRRVLSLQTLTHGTESNSAVSYKRRVLSLQTLTHGTESNSAEFFLTHWLKQAPYFTDSAVWSSSRWICSLVKSKSLAKLFEGVALSQKQYCEKKCLFVQ